MKRDHRFLLEKGSKKHLCPAPDCGKKTFVRYMDTQTGNYLPEQYGRCDRESKCTYLLNPYRDGYVKMIRDQERGNFSGDWKSTLSKFQPKPIKKMNPAFIPIDVFKETRHGYDQNIFIQNMLTRILYPFEPQDIEKVISLYNLGTITTGYRSGGITFPFIDLDRNVRAVQVKQFDQTNHTTSTDFLHSIIEKQYVSQNEPLPTWLQAYKQNESIVSCLFGEYLLDKYPHNTVALVEAPKTAIYGTLYFGFPDQPENLLWLAVYNLSSITLEKCKVLKGRDVVLFPDLSKDGRAFQEWSKKAKQFAELLPGTRLEVSDLLERFAPHELKVKGADIADVLIKIDWRKFRAAPADKSDERDESDPPKQSLFLAESKTNSVIQIQDKAQEPAIEKTYQEIPTEATQLFYSIMFEMEDYYFTHPLIDKLRKEAPFSDTFKSLWNQIRSSPVKGTPRYRHLSMTNQPTLFMEGTQKISA